MGMFTTIVEADGTTWQIKTGDDQLYEFLVGQEVDIQDGLYGAWGSAAFNGYDHCFVAIKDRTVLSVHPFKESMGELADFANGLCDRFDIPYEPREYEVPKRAWGWAANLEHDENGYAVSIWQVPDWVTAITRIRTKTLKEAFDVIDKLDMGLGRPRAEPRQKPRKLLP